MTSPESLSVWYCEETDEVFLSYRSSDGVRFIHDYGNEFCYSNVAPDFFGYVYIGEFE